MELRTKGRTKNDETTRINAQLCCVNFSFDSEDVLERYLLAHWVDPCNLLDDVNSVRLHNEANL